MSQDEKVKKLAELSMIINGKLSQAEQELKLWKEVVSIVEESLREKSFKTVEPPKQPLGPMPLHLQQTVQEPAKIPEFDPEVLMNWEWKGKKIAENEYSKGSTAWGWEFANKLPDAVIKVLPITIAGCTFSLSKDGKFVNAGKEK